MTTASENCPFFVGDSDDCIASTVGANVDPLVDVVVGDSVVARDVGDTVESGAVEKGAVGTRVGAGDDKGTGIWVANCTGGFVGARTGNGVGASVGGANVGSTRVIVGVGEVGGVVVAAKVGPALPEGAVGGDVGRRVGERVGTGAGETAGGGVRTPLDGLLVTAGPDTPSTRKVITIPDSLIS